MGSGTSTEDTGHGSYARLSVGGFSSWRHRRSASRNRPDGATTHNKVLPAPLTSFAPAYMALNQLWLGSGVQLTLRQAARAVSVVGHVGNI